MIEAIAKRKSIRSFADKKVETEKVDPISSRSRAVRWN